MKSMTGFGRAERIDDEVHAVVEIKSVNNRYLDISMSLPGSLSPLEPMIREAISRVALRGRVEVFVRVRELGGEITVHVDQGAVAGYLSAISDLKEKTGVDDQLRLEHLLSLDGVLSVERLQDRDRYWAVIEPLLNDALRDFEATRCTEGERLGHDIERQLGRIATAVDGIAESAPKMEQQVKENLRNRFSEVVGDSVEETRLLAEIAVQLSRVSINEEIVRLRAHLDSFRSTAAGDGQVGKRLDFLCQEVHREINTTGSKSVILDISRHVVEAKDALENVREQLRNVE